MKMKRYLLLTLMTFALLPLVAQTAMKRGDAYFKDFNFEEAAIAYKKAVDKAPDNVEAKQKLAMTYYLMNDYASAEPWFAQVVQFPNIEQSNKVYYGLTLRALGKYEDADKIFTEYSLKNPKDPRGSELSGQLGKVKELGTDNLEHTVEIMQGINSSLIEFGPSFFQNGALLFTSNRERFGGVLRDDVWTGDSYFDIYEVSAEGGVPGIKSSRLKGKDPNRKYHDGPACYNEATSTIVFTRTSSKKSSDNNALKLKLYSAKWDSSGKWSEVKELPFNNNDYSVGHPALSKDGKKLFFMSDMPGGQGDMDIYVSTREGEAWGKPVNLGTGVNTPGREAFPFIADDGTLYFASDSRVGLGGYDVYRSTFMRGEWQRAENVGTPINTRFDDFGYIINGKNQEGYFVSNREGGVGQDDIYKFKKQSVATKICVEVYDSLSGEPIETAAVKPLVDGIEQNKKPTDNTGTYCEDAKPNSNYTFYVTKEGYAMGSASVTAEPGKTTTAKVLLGKPGYQPPADATSGSGGYDLVVCVTEKGKGNLAGATVTLTNKATGERRTCITNADCKCNFSLKPDSDYEVCASKDMGPGAEGGYDTDCKEISTRGVKAPATLNANLTLQYLTTGTTVRMENIYYDLDKSYIRSDAAVELNKLVKILKQYPDMEIELSSHTDCRNSRAYNVELSARRAIACINYLVSKGIDKSRLIAVGYGETRLVNNCACEPGNDSPCSDAEHQQNRRTEFKVLKW